MSVSSTGSQATGTSHVPVVSPDGRFVAFSSYAPNIVAGDGNANYDVFVTDRQTGITKRVSVDSVGVEGDAASMDLAISADARFVAFQSYATNLVANDTNGLLDIFVHDQQAGTTERVSVDSAGAQATGGTSWEPSISAAGRFVAFASEATNLVDSDTNGVKDIFVRDRQTGVTTRVSLDSAGNESNGASENAAISADGRFVAFRSFASNLVAGDTNGDPDIFVHDRQTGATERVSVNSTGAQGLGGASFDTSISGDGRLVAFESAATNLVANDTNGNLDVFVHDRLTGITERASVSSAGDQADDVSFDVSISTDGRYVAFHSMAGNLVPDDTNTVSDVFVRDRLLRTTQRVSVDSAGNQAVGADSVEPSISGDGGFVAFRSGASNLVAGDIGYHDIFLRDRGLLPDGNNDFLADFGAAGTWQRLNDTSWQKIHNGSPLAMASGDLDGSLQDDAIMSFSGAGLWARYDNATWKKLHSAAPARFVSGDLDGNGSDELVVDFGGAGLWVLRNDATWAKIYNAATQELATGDFDGDGKDDLVVDFGTAGLWARYDDTTWAKLHNGSPAHIATGDLDGNGRAELIADFGAAGIWARYNNATWTKLRNSTSEGLATGDLDGNGQEELVADLGAEGLWVRYNNANWVKRHNGSPIRMLATDLDGSGQADLVVDFGAAGLWVKRNNGAWAKLHNATTQGLAAGGFD